MLLVNKFDRTEKVSKYLTVNSSWSDFSSYFMWLGGAASGCSKLSSGTMSLHFKQFWDTLDQALDIELGGYDCTTLSRNHVISIQRGPDLELRAKTELLLIFEAERLAQETENLEGHT